MKAIVLTLMIFTSFVANAQQSSITKVVRDHVKTISIKVDANINGKTIFYDSTFNAEHLTKEERNALVEKILNSLGVNETTSSSKQVAEETPEQTGNYDSSKSFTKEVQYDSNSGKLSLKYLFSKDGKNNIYQTTLDAKDLTPEQREVIIKNYEEKIGLTNHVK